MNSLLYAARPLLNDFLSSIVFVALLALKVDPAVATLSVIVFAVAHLACMQAAKRAVAPLQWASLGLVLVFGAASLVLHDARFLMAKPSVIYLIVAAVMMRRGWMLRYLPPVARGHGDGLMIGFGYAWAGLMALTAVANLVMAVWFTRDWPMFMATVPLASKIALFAVQFLSVRIRVRRGIVAQRTAPGLSQAASA